MAEYVDPENVVDIKEQIKNAPNLGSLKLILDKVFPGWIKGLVDDYSDDYPILKKNWLEMCTKNKVIPTKIMIVDFVSFEEEYSLLRIFCEILTLSGFCVRSKQEIFPCKICKRAIPQLHIYNLMKTNGERMIPDVWQTSCQKCV